LKITVLDSATLGEDLDLSPLSEVMETEIYVNTPPESVAERIAESDVVIINKVKLNESNLAGAKNLKLICVAATGYDNIDVAYCKMAGIAVCNVVGYSSLSVAQITVATVLSLSCHLHEHTETVRSGRYTASGVANSLTPVYHELAGKTWGIVGYGNIGKQVGRVAEALGCRVIYNKRTPDKNSECVSLETLCKESDIITIHTPLSDSTRGLISKDMVSLMKNDVIVVNEARGAVTDEAALSLAVKEGRIGALGCDVYSVEPFGTDHPFYEIKERPNVCLTPHMAWGAYEARVRCLGEIVLNIKAFFNGEIRNRVDLL
jgi:glycerate dehydrogenase